MGKETEGTREIERTNMNSKGNKIEERETRKKAT